MLVYQRVSQENSNKHNLSTRFTSRNIKPSDKEATGVKAPGDKLGVSISYQSSIIMHYHPWPSYLSIQLIKHSSLFDSYLRKSPIIIVCHIVYYVVYYKEYNIVYYKLYNIAY